jgi:PAS domain S-box-containing protein
VAQTPVSLGFIKRQITFADVWNNRTMANLIAIFFKKMFKPSEVGADLDFENSPRGVLFVEVHSGQIKRANSVFSRMLDCPLSQVLGSTWADLAIPVATVSARDKSFDGPVNALTGQPLESAPSPSWVQVFKRSDGQTVTTEVSYLTQLKGLENKPIWVLTVEDIAERLKDQTQLRLSEQRHRVVADNARDVIWSMSPMGEITYVSPAVEKLRGVTPQEAMRMPLNETLTPDSAAVTVGYFQQVSQALQRGQKPANFEGELEYFRKDGSTFWTECLTYPLLDDNGSLLEIVGVTRDISERKLYEDNLRQARLQAEKADQAKTRFLGHISHELRTPLSEISALNELLLHSQIDVPQRAWLSRSQDAARLLMGMISDLLDLSRLDSGQLVLARQNFQLNAVLQQVQSMAVRSCTAKGLDFKLELDPDVPDALLGDAPRLTQALLSLVNNAIKFTDQGWVQIRVQRKEVEKNFVRLQFTVDDTGWGLDEAMQNEVLAGFAWGERAQGSGREGVGLGLNICKRLVQLMGGQMGLSTQLGQGSSFWFAVRLQLPGQASQAVSPQTMAPTQSLAGVKVLVVDDNPSIRDIVRQLLLLAEVTVDTAENGLEALDKIRQNPYDLVLMDLQMPLMDGLEATRQIRLDSAFASLPIVALTAGGFDSEWAQWRAQGMSDWLGKPFDYQKMLTVLRRNLPASDLS